MLYGIILSDFLTIAHVTHHACFGTGYGYASLHLALWEGGAVARAMRFRRGRTTGTFLPCFEMCLMDNPSRRVDLIACGTGPGSFTVYASR